MVVCYLPRTKKTQKIAKTNNATAVKNKTLILIVNLTAICESNKYIKVSCWKDVIENISSNKKLGVEGMQRNLGNTNLGKTNFTKKKSITKIVSRW